MTPDPSPASAPDRAAPVTLRNKIASAGALCVFAEPHFDPRVVKVVVEGTKARTGTLDPEGTTLTPGPDLYVTLMRTLATNLKACLTAE